MASEVIRAGSDMGETYDSKGTKLQNLSPMFCESVISTPLYKDHTCSPSERHIGFWKRETGPSAHVDSLASSTTRYCRGAEGSLMSPSKNGQKNCNLNMRQDSGYYLNKGEMFPGGNLSDPSIIEPKSKQVHGSSSGQEWLRSHLNQMMIEHDSCVFGLENNTSLLSASWAAPHGLPGPNGVWYGLASSAQLNSMGRTSAYNRGSEDRLSSSIPALFQNKLRLSTPDPTTDELCSSVTQDEDPRFDSLAEHEWHTIGNILPDDEELYLSVIDDLDGSANANTAEENEDFDLFSSGGGMELDSDAQDSLVGSKNSTKLAEVFSGVSVAQHASGSVPGEHPYGEHPSRTLFVRNINSNVEDTELRAIFEQYGAIRTLYTACKHRGFVMISYYDIRAARSALRALQNKPLRRRKLDIHFSIPKDNPSDKDVNQGTLVVFNLDASVSNDDLRQIFGVYGEVKEIRETPHKRHHKFIEFYDVRSAEAALRALNRCDIAGKRIKLEPSRPGGARRSLMQQLTQEPEQEERGSFGQHANSPLTESPLGHNDYRGCLESHMENGSGKNNVGKVGSLMGHCLYGVSSVVPSHIPSPARVGNCLVYNGSIEACQSSGNTDLRLHQSPQLRPHTFVELCNGITKPVQYSPSAVIQPAMSGLVPNAFQETGISSYNNISLIEPPNSGNRLSSYTNLTGSLPGHGLLCRSLNSLYHEGPQILWPLLSVSSSCNSNGHLDHSSYTEVESRGHLVAAPSSQHHVFSAPAADFSLLDQHCGYLGEPLESSSLRIANGSLGALGHGRKTGIQALNSGFHSHTSPDVVLRNGVVDCGAFQSLCAREDRGCMLSKSVHDIPPTPPEWVNKRGRGRKSDTAMPQNDKKQFQLDIDRILRGEDMRTTLMIKNIPNKYTSKMLLAAIDENHRGTYDFIYLPIDFKNKCNVGYAFINMTEPSRIVPFYQAFNGKKWEKFNSEKVASLAYARIQGKAALVTHFQNSSLLNEDKRCRPILFHSGGPHIGDQEPFPAGANPRMRMSKTHANMGSHQGSLTSSSSSKDEALYEANFLDGSLLMAPCTVMHATFPQKLAGCSLDCYRSLQ